MMVTDHALDMHAFLVTRWGGDPVNAAPDEHDDLRWFQPSDLAHLTMAHPACRSSIVRAVLGQPTACEPIVVFGGTGYTGGNVVREAASRGHQVTAVSRSQPKDSVPGVRYEVGKVEDLAPRVVPGADVVVATLSPRGDMAGRLVDAYEESRDCRQRPARAICRWADSLTAAGARPASLRRG